MAKSEGEQTEKTHVVPCRSCERHVNAGEVGGYSYFDDNIGDPVGFILLRCPACDQPMLAAQDYTYSGHENWEPAEPRIVYPEPYKQLSYDVPEVVRKSYEEAVRCFSSKAFTASAIMCRRTLEALVGEKLGKPRALSSGIAELKKLGLIDPQLVEWADALRVSGNKAAHDVGTNVSKQDAQDVIEFSHALIEYVFTYKQKFEEFKKRSQAAAKPTPKMPPT